MSQNKRNTSRTDKTRFDVGLVEICIFLRFIWCASGVFFLICMLGMIVFKPDAASLVAYQLTALFSGVTAVGAFLACRILGKKEADLTKREQKARELDRKRKAK